MKITVVGNAVVMTSTMKFDDLKAIAKYRKEALTLMGGKEGKEPIFTIDVKDKGGINGNGITFAKSREGGLAQITVVLDNVQGDIKEYIADTYGAAINYVGALEETLPAVFEEIKAERATVMNSITVQQ